MFSRFLAFCLLFVLSPASASFITEVAECSKLFGLSVAAAVTYGVLHNQVTVRLSPTYFSHGFKRNRELLKGPVLGRLKNILEKTQSPTVIGSIWGFLVLPIGVIFSVPVVVASRIGNWPKLSASNLMIPATIALGGVGVASLVSGIRGYHWAKNANDSEKFNLYGACDTEDENFDLRIAVARTDRMVFDHGIIAGLGLAAYALIKRYTMA